VARAPAADRFFFQDAARNVPRRASQPHCARLAGHLRASSRSPPHRDTLPATPTQPPKSAPIYGCPISTSFFSLYRERIIERKRITAGPPPQFLASVLHSFSRLDFFNLTGRERAGTSGVNTPLDLMSMPADVVEILPVLTACRFVRLLAVGIPCELPFRWQQALLDGWPPAKA